MGYQAEEIVGCTVDDLNIYVNQNERAQLLQELRDNGTVRNYPLSVHDKTGNVRSLLVGMEPTVYGSEEVIISTFIDITDRIRDENRIKHLNEVLHAIQDVNQLIVHEKDRDTLLQRSCEILVSTRGYRSAWVALRGEDGKAQTVAESGIGDDFASVRESLQKGEWPECCRRAWEDPNGVTPIHNTKDNCRKCALSHTYRDTAALAGVLRHDDRDYGALVVALPAGLADDREEQALFRELLGDVAYALYAMESAKGRLEEETKFRSYVENAPYGIFIADREGRYLDVNPSACDISGYAREELLAMRIPDLLAPDYREAGLQNFQTLVDSGYSDGEFGFIRQGGEVRQWRVLAEALSPDRFLGFVEDITEREKLQAQLIQAQKMESVGRLAGGVAHDYNNMLSVIIGFTEIALEKTAPEDSLHADLQEVLNAGHRSTDITRQLLAFARQQTIAPRVLELNETVEDMLKMLRRLIGEDIDLFWKPEPGRMQVFLDPSQIDQILANLCVNARDAIGGGG